VVEVLLDVHPEYVFVQGHGEVNQIATTTVESALLLQNDNCTSLTGKFNLLLKTLSYTFKIC
jgi:hypothetical protein